MQNSASSSIKLQILQSSGPHLVMRRKMKTPSPCPRKKRQARSHNNQRPQTEPETALINESFTSCSQLLNNWPRQRIPRTSRHKTSAHISNHRLTFAALYHVVLRNLSNGIQSRLVSPSGEQRSVNKKSRCTPNTVEQHFTLIVLSFFEMYNAATSLARKWIREYSHS